MFFRQLYTNALSNVEWGVLSNECRVWSSSSDWKFSHSMSRFLDDNDGSLFQFPRGFVQHGPKPTDQPIATGIVLGVLGVLSFTYDFQDMSGHYTVYILTTVGGIEYVRMYLTRDSLAGQSLPIAVTFFIGAFSGLILMFHMHPEWKFMIFLGLTLFTFSVAYIVLIARRTRADGIGLLERW